MEEYDIYRDIRERTGGDVYIGVVGPVRAGKSTFITNFMKNAVLPKMEDDDEMNRLRDELPQSANGRTIMTTQPKFVPNQAVELKLSDNVDVKVRLVDCVGYLIEGATGNVDEDNNPRMVKTPWSDEAMPFEKAAETGTQKVIRQHSTVGIVVTTDGSIDTEIPRVNYVAAEERVVNELTALGKPFIVILNSSVPGSSETQKLAANLSEKYSAKVMPIDVLNMGEEDVLHILENLLMEFPLSDVNVNVNKWVRALPRDNEIIASLCSGVLSCCENMTKMSDWEKVVKAFEESPFFENASADNIDLGSGRITYSVKVKEGLFYRALSDTCGDDISDDFALMSYVKELAGAKREYDKIKNALESVRQTGYGVVTPSIDEMKLEQPEIVRQGSRYGVKLKASAPSLHIMEVDVSAEVSPIMGTEQQSEETVKKMIESFEGDELGIWKTEMFGKTMNVLVNDGINDKLANMPPEAQRKMRKTLSRIINEGKGGVICILL